MALVLVPPAGLALVALGTLVAGQARADRGWAVVWLAFAVPVCGALLLFGEFATGARMLGQAILGFAAAALLRPAPQVALRGLAGGLVLLGAVIVLAQVNAPYLWNSLPNDNSFAHLVQRLTTGTEKLEDRRSRLWNLASAQEDAEMVLPVRLLEGATGWSWVVNGPVEVQPVQESVEVHSRLVFGREGDPYGQRTFDLGSPAGGRTFRVRLEMRSSRPLERAACRGVWLQVWGQGGGSSCKAVALTREWRHVEHEWTAPAAAESSIVRIVLNNFDGEIIETRRVQLFENVADRALPLAPLTPEGVSLRLIWEGGSRTSTFVPVAAGSDFRLPVPPAVLAQGGRLTVELAPAAGLSIAVGPVAFQGARARPASQPIRPGLWFGHPNLVAHSMASAGLTALVLARSGLGWRALALLGATGILLTGSRTAFAAFLGGAVMIHLLRSNGRRFKTVLMLLPLLLTATGVLGLSLLGNQQISSLLPFNQGQTTLRTDIWRSATEAVAEHPWRGLVGAESDFTSWWRERGTTRERVRHAHNIFLEYAVAFGLPGLLSISALGVGLLVLSMRGGGRRGIPLAGAVLFMNLADATLFYGGVLFPLVLGINALSDRSAPHGEQVS